MSISRVQRQLVANTVRSRDEWKARALAAEARIEAIEAVLNEWESQPQSTLAKAAERIRATA